MRNICVCITLMICAHVHTETIHQHIRNNNYSKLDQLITNNQNLMKQTDNNGYPTLHYAVRKGLYKSAKILLQNGFQANLAAQVVPPEHVNTKTKKARKVTGKDTFDRIKRNPLQLAVSNGDAKIVRLLLEHDASPNAGPKNTPTPLTMAVIQEDAKIVDMLIQRGANINKTFGGEAPLHAAIGPTDDDVAMVRKLLQAGADPNIQAVGNRTPLHEAVSVNPRIVELLLDRNAKPNIKDKNGFTPLHTAAAAQDTSIVAKSTRILIENGAQIEAHNNDEETPIFIAARSGNISVLKLLLKKGADVHVKNHNGDTPLHVAARHAQPQAVTTLLRAKARADAANRKDETPRNVALAQRAQEKEKSNKARIDTEKIKKYDKIVRKLKKSSTISRIKTSRRLSE